MSSARMGPHARVIDRATARSGRWTDPPWGAWFRQHLGPLSQMAAFLAGAVRAGRARRARHDRDADDARAARHGDRQQRPAARVARRRAVIGPVLLVFNWLITALSFPIIGLAVLYFPHRAEMLDRHKWIVPAVIAASLPMFVIGIGHGGVPARLRRDAAGAVVARRCTAGRSRRRSRIAARGQRADRRRRHRRAIASTSTPTSGGASRSSSSPACRRCSPTR